MHVYPSHCVRLTSVAVCITQDVAWLKYHLVKLKHNLVTHSPSCRYAEKCVVFWSPRCLGIPLSSVCKALSLFIGYCDCQSTNWPSHSSISVLRLLIPLKPVCWRKEHCPVSNGCSGESAYAQQQQDNGRTSAKGRSQHFVIGSRQRWKVW